MKYDKEINQKAVKEGRRRNYKKVKESMAIFKKTKYTYINNIICDESWDNCVNIKKRFDGDDFVIYQKKEGMEIIEDYFIQKYKRNNSVKIIKRFKNLGKLINKFYDYDNLRVQRRQHECPISKRKRIKSAIKLNKSISKYTIEGKYIFDTTKKNKNEKKEENKEEDNNINNDNNDDEEYNFNLMNNLYYDL